MLLPARVAERPDDGQPQPVNGDAAGEVHPFGGAEHEGMAAATARPTVKRFPELEAATPTIEASTNAVTAPRASSGR